MKKSLIVLAIAGAFAAPAFADTANVTVGGYMNFSFDYLDADQSTTDVCQSGLVDAYCTSSNGGNFNVSSNSSNIYFKGSEDLGGGLKGVWQIQTYFSAGRTGNGDSSFGATLDGVGSGNTYLGVAGDFGTVLMGKHEAPVKLLSRSVDFFNNQIGDSRNLTNGDQTLVNIGVPGMDIRPNNVLAYASPNWGGFSGMAAYVTNVAVRIPPTGTALLDMPAGATTDTSIDAWSFSGKYENGPLMVGLGYQVHNISEALVGAGEHDIWRLVGSYAIGDFKVAGLYQQEDEIAGTSGLDRTVWGLGGSYAMGPITLKGQYYNAGETGGWSDTGADLWALGLDYTLSKRTKAQFAYAAADNDAFANYSAFGGGHGDNPSGVAYGTNPQGFSVGLVHTF